MPQLSAKRQAFTIKRNPFFKWRKPVFAHAGWLWSFTKVRYRGLAKNAGRAFTALALANIYLSRNQLMAQVRQ